MTVTKRDQLKLPKRKKAVVSLTHNTEYSLPTYHFLSAEFQHARQHEKGIIRDDHIEFLHQYRVSLRRCRALISLLKPLFTKQQKSDLKDVLKILMQNTNQLRDLDVFLLKMDDYFYDLEHCYHQGLTLFFDELQDQRGIAFKALKKWLKEDQYQQQCQHISEQLEELKTPKKRSAISNDFKQGRSILWHHFTQVEHCCLHITQQSPDTDLHHLRINCKKLRYLLEFFSPLLPKKSVKEQINQLKQLQDKLGEFNDSSVQLAFFADYLTKKKVSSKRYQAINELLNITQTNHLTVRNQAIEQLTTFMLPVNLDSYRALKVEPDL
ncbi:CHAD domain-containing protein [Photobacterium makurazakiensis]|uniref:CHAD domain-containing protein n=1 Tax=Photobacterium makurazakiensis TaxID=2910234 RepID=UPI003D0D55D0